MRNKTVKALGHYTSVNVDGGFRPNPNGFSFSNQGYSYVDNSASWSLFKRAFPATSMENSDGSRKQAAEQFFLNSFLTAGAGGHCRGFSHASLIYYSGLKSLETTEDDGLTSPNNNLSNPYSMIWRSDAQDYIHIYQARWYTVKAGQGRYVGTPSYILQLVKDALPDFKDNALDIAIFASGSGHSVVPYRIEHVNSLDRIYVYDNNFPGNQEKYIEIDTAANTWRYNIWGSIFWQGSSTSGSIYVDPAKNNFPGTVNLSNTPVVGLNATTSASTVSQIIIAGDVLPLFTNENGQQLGIVGDQYVNTIPGATINVLPMFDPNNPDAQATVVYQLPLTARYTLQAYAPNGGVYTMTAFAPGLATELNGLDAVPGSTDEFILQTGLRQINISANGSDKDYCYYFADDQLNDASRSFNLCTSARIGGQATFTVASDSNQVAYQNNGQAANYVMTIAQTGIQAGQEIITGTAKGYSAINAMSVPGTGPGGLNWLVGEHQVYLPLILR